MTIKDFVNEIKVNSLSHKFVNYFNEGDVYEIMNEGEKEYGSVILTINSIRANLKETVLNCYLFYIDRLIEDDSNKLDIWAQGANTLQKIIYKTGYNNYTIIADHNVDYQPFKEKFQDLTAGVYATVNFTIISDVNNCLTEID